MTKISQEGRKEGRREGRMDGWKDGWMDGWMDGWKEGWKDGWCYDWSYFCFGLFVCPVSFGSFLNRQIAVCRRDAVIG